MQDYAYYSANSGLTPATLFALDDHYLAWLKVKTGRTTGTIDDLSSLLYGGGGGERGYYLTQLGVSGIGMSLADLKQAFLASGDIAPAVAIYDSSTYNSTAVYA